LGCVQVCVQGVAGVGCGVLLCRERVCVCLAVSVVSRLNERPVNADHCLCYHVSCVVRCAHRRPRARAGECRAHNDRVTVSADCYSASLFAVNMGENFDSLDEKKH
jgi:hypothetical protein